VSYRLYTIVIGSLLTTWCISNLRFIKSEKPDTQFGFYSGPNTQQPMFTLRHLRNALPAPLSQATLPGCILPSLTINKTATQSPDRLFGLISVACTCLHRSSLLFRACMQVTSNSYKTSIKLQGLSLLWVCNKGALCLHCYSYCT